MLAVINVATAPFLCCNGSTKAGNANGENFVCLPRQDYPGMMKGLKSPYFSCFYPFFVFRSQITNESNYQ